MRRLSNMTPPMRASGCARLCCVDDELVQRLEHALLPAVEEHRAVEAALLVVALDREERAHVDLLEPPAVAALPFGAVLDRVARGVAGTAPPPA